MAAQDCTIVGSTSISPEYPGGFATDEAGFLNLCDLYSMIMHPTYEALAEALGFQKMRNEPSSIYLMFLALDHFFALDITEVFQEEVQ
jgi:hypothetical protein